MQKQSKNWPGVQYPLKSIILRNRSLSNARWFNSKKHKIGKRNLYLTENRLSRNEMWCAAYKSQLCVKYVQENEYPSLYVQNDF